MLVLQFYLVGLLIRLYMVGSIHIFSEFCLGDLEFDAPKPEGSLTTRQPAEDL